MNLLPSLDLGELSIHPNQNKLRDNYPDQLEAILSLASAEAALSEIRQWDNYQPTPLYRLQNLAGALGLNTIHFKDECLRLGLGSFKALGGAYGVLRFLQRYISQRLGEAVSLEDIRTGRYLSLTKNLTVVTATDGNHGRSVAWGAQQFGCLCRVYIHAEVSSGRQQAIEVFAAQVVRIDGNYDDSVHAAAEDSARNDWHVISDTSYEGYTEVPGDIMAGYMVMAEEIHSQIPEDQMPTHIFLQGGVGALASAVCANFWQHYGEKSPRMVIVEPDRAACLLASGIAGKATSVRVEEETIMAGLSCGEVSLLAWEILQLGTDDFITISDSAVPDAMRLLASGYNGDPAIEAGESAVAGLIGLVAATSSGETAEALGLDTNSRVLLIGTEGATDPEIYRSILQR